MVHFSRFHQIILISILLLVLAFIISAVLVKPSMYSDSGWGFITMESMLDGGKFNYIKAPSILKISDNSISFNNTWTPGQYIFSYYLIKELGISLGASLIIVTSLMSIMGLAGFYVLFKSLKIPQSIILMSLLIVICQRYFSLPFSIYNGGEIIIFGFIPWLIWLSIISQRINWLHYLLLLAIGVVGFYLKTTALISFVAICLFLIAKQINSLRKIPKNLVFKIVLVVLVIATVCAICYLTFLKNGTYSDQKFKFSFQPINSLFLLAHPIASAFSLDDLFKRVFEFPGNPYSINIIKYASAVYYSLFAALSIYTIYLVGSLKQFNNYKKLCISFIIVYSIVFLVFYNKTEVTGSIEMRHFRSVGMLFIPGILLLLKYNIKNYVVLSIFCPVILVSSLYGLSSFAQRKVATAKNAYVGRQNFSHEIIDAETLEFIYSLDKNLDKKDIIYVTSPEIALEIKNARTIISSADFETEAQLSAKYYNGKARSIYLCYQQRFGNGAKEAIIINSFKSYGQKRIIYSNGIFKILELF